MTAQRLGIDIKANKEKMINNKVTWHRQVFLHVEELGMVSCVILATSPDVLYKE